MTSDLIATSYDLCSENQDVLMTNDDTFIVIRANKKVVVICLNTGRFVCTLLEGDVVFIWKNDVEDDVVFCAVKDEGNSQQISVVEVRVPSGKIVKRTELPPGRAKVPSHLARLYIRRNDEGFVDQLHCVGAVGKNSYEIVSQSVKANRKLLLGQVSFAPGRNSPLMGVNSEILAKICPCVKGMCTERLVCMSLESGQICWFQNMDNARPATAVCVSPNDNIVAVGDKSGRIRIFRDKGWVAMGHWHSLPVQSLAFVPDGTSMLSGGGEGVLVKWDIKTMTRIAVVPRLGSTIVQIFASYTKVVAFTAANTIKVFTADLEDDKIIAGLNSSTSFRRLAWHAPTATVVLIGGQHMVQFFDPSERRQKFALEAVGQNIVLGERDEPVRTSHLALFDMSHDGQWLVTVESHWDKQGPCVLKLWNFSNNKFSMGTRVNEPHTGDLESCQFVMLGPKLKLGLVSCGKTDKKAKLWQLESGTTKWGLVRTFQYLGLDASRGATSRDGSVLILAFGSVLCVYDTKTLGLMSSMSSPGSSPFTSVSFGVGPMTFTVITANKSGLYLWDLLTFSLRFKMDLDSPTIVPWGGTSKLFVRFSGGILSLDSALRPRLVSSAASSVVCAENNGEKFYLLDGSPNGEHTLRSVVSTKFSGEMKPVRPYERPGNKFNLTELKVTAEEDIYTARAVPLIDGDMLTPKLSQSADFIIKRALPV